VEGSFYFESQCDVGGAQNQWGKNCIFGEKIRYKELGPHIQRGRGPNPFSLALKRFLTHLELTPSAVARSGAVQAVRRNLCAIPTLRAQPVDTTNLPLCQDVLTTGFKNRSKEFWFGQQPVKSFSFFAILILLSYAQVSFCLPIFGGI
jgi:hypothetical protein